MLTRLLTRGMVVCALVAALGTVAASAQGPYPRIKVVEEWSSATCVPCVQATPVVDAAVLLDSGVVSIRYHMHFPAPNDPWNLYNPDEPTQRYLYYDNSGNLGIPKAVVNGGVPLDPRPSTDGAVFTAQVRNAARTSPIEITVTQNGGKIKVRVRTNIALNNHKLQVALVSRYASVPNIGSLMGGSPSNGETTFHDMMNKMYPDHNGTALSIPANGDQTFEFPASVIANDVVFPPGQQYAIAFVQSNTSKEILQGGVSADRSAFPNQFTFFTRSKVETSSTNPYQRVARGATSEIDVTVTNKGTAAATADLSVSNLATLTGVGMNASFSPTSVSLNANESKTVKLSVVGSTNRSQFVSVVPSLGASDGLPVGANSLYYLVEGGRVVAYYGFGNTNWALGVQSALNSTQGRSGDVVYMPFSAELQSHYPVTEFDAALFQFDDAWLSMQGATFTAIQAMEALGKGLWISGQANMFTTFEQSKNGGNANFQPVRDFFTKTLGVDYAGTRYRVVSTQQGTAVYSFAVKGTAGDSIGAGLAFTANQYIQGQWQAYMIQTDVMKLTPTSKAKSWLYYSDSASVIGGIRVVTANGSRTVYSTLDYQGVPPLATRDLVTQRVLDYIAIKAAAAAPILYLATPVMQYGNVQLNTSKDIPLAIKNTGNASLVISNVAIEGGDAGFFQITAGGTASGSVTIAPNTTHTMTVRFTPTEERTGYHAAISFTSNAETSQTAQLVGNGVVQASSVETDVTSETGAIGLRLIGANPVTDASAIELRSLTNTTVTIIDAAGRTVSTIFNGASTGTQQLSMQTASLPSGSYSVVASNGSERAVLSIVVAH